MTKPTRRDPQAEQDHAEFAGWMDAQGHPNEDGYDEYGFGDMRDAFTAGAQAARDLDDATLAAEVRAGHVRIAVGVPQPADPGAMPACLADVGERIRLAREAARIEQRVLAAEVGVTQAGVSRWESGQRDPGVAALIRIASALGVPAAALLPAGDAGSVEAGLAEARGILAEVLGSYAASGSGHVSKMTRVQHIRLKMRAGLPVTDEEGKMAGA